MTPFSCKKGQKLIDKLCEVGTWLSELLTAAVQSDLWTTVVRISVDRGEAVEPVQNETAAVQPTPETGEYVQQY